ASRGEEGADPGATRRGFSPGRRPRKCGVTVARSFAGPYAAFVARVYVAPSTVHPCVEEPVMTTRVSRVRASGGRPASLPLRLARLLPLLLLTLISGCGPSRAWGPEATPAASSGTVTLQPGDKVRVQIWREEDLSGEFTVL